MFDSNIKARNFKKRHTVAEGSKMATSGNHNIEERSSTASKGGRGDSGSQSSRLKASSRLAGAIHSQLEKLEQQQASKEY